MLANFVEEQTNAPGNGSTINLGGPPAGRVAWRKFFSNGAIVFYCISDSTQAEWGIGTLTYGSPDTLSRATVIKTSSGGTSRLNFTGACRVFNEVPAENMLYIDQNNKPNLDGSVFQIPSFAGLAGGTANVITAFLSPAPSSMKPGMLVRFIAPYSSTGLVTLNLNGLGAYAIMRSGVSAIDGSLVQVTNGDIATGDVVEVIFDGTYWRMLSTPSSNRVPIGALIDYTAGALPKGYLWPDGRNVSRATYPMLSALYANSGFPFGAGDGVTTFTLPDLRGRFALGRDALGGALAGRATFAYVGVDPSTLGVGGGSQAMHQHTHAVFDPSHNHAAFSDSQGDHNHTYSGLSLVGGSGIQAGSGYQFSGTSTSNAGSHTHGIGTLVSTTGISLFASGDGGSQNMPPFLALNKILYAGA